MIATIIYLSLGFLDLIGRSKMKQSFLLKCFFFFCSPSIPLMMLLQLFFYPRLSNENLKKKDVYILNVMSFIYSLLVWYYLIKKQL